ncbi:MAG: hypothetical protein AMJ81_01150 [Phycisphaerae bacterium SM23_33]|nr:MAG: hypothetical protein AMJ81_01150 [Phycisphaerae bacterium SM23_33]
MKEAVNVRYAGWLKTVLLGSLLVAGCGDSGKAAARKKLADRVDEARRLYGHAASTLAYPSYVDKVTGLSVALDETVVLKDGTRLEGQVTRVGRKYRIQARTGQAMEVSADQVARIDMFKTPDADIDVSTQPAQTSEAVKLLDRARGLVSDALQANPKASPGAKADAEQLLGDIEFARGNLLAGQADQLRRRGAELRGHARALVNVARNHAVLMDFSKALANMSRKKIQQTHDDGQKELAAVNARIDAIDVKIADRRKQMAALTAGNAELLKEVQSLRDESEREGGPKGLELLKQAHARDRTRNDNQAKIDAAVGEIDNLLVDKGLEQGNAAAVQAKLAVIKAHLASMDEHAQAAEKAAQQAQADVDRTFKDVQAVAERIVQTCREAAAKEPAALNALAASAGHFGGSETQVRAERQAAESVQGERAGALTEVVRELADDKHLAGIVAAGASAELAQGELRSQQLAAAKDNAALAQAITELAKQIGQDPPAVVEQLKAPLANEAATRQSAVKNYQQAEAGLERVVQTHLRDSIGRNTLWIYQGQLADTYLGHYRLTGDADVLTKAKKSVDDALSGREQSDYLRSVVRLRGLIEAAGE